MQYIQSENGPGEQKQAVVVIDPGHGGTDPGKVGIDGQLEKDINLAVAKKLKTYLEASDVKVVLTRDVDTGLYSSKDTHKKCGYEKALPADRRGKAGSGDQYPSKQLP